MATKFAKAYGKRGVLFVIAALAALVAAKGGGHWGTQGFFDGG